MEGADLFWQSSAVVNGIRISNFDFMRLNVEFLGIYVIYAPIIWMSKFLFREVGVNKSWYKDIQAYLWEPRMALWGFRCGLRVSSWIRMFQT